MKHVCAPEKDILERERRIQVVRGDGDSRLRRFHLDHWEHRDFYCTKQLPIRETEVKACHRFGIRKTEGHTFGDQSKSVTDLPCVQRSSENAQNNLTFWPSPSSLFISGVRRRRGNGSLQGTIDSYRVIPYIIVPIAQSSLDDLCRFLYECREIRGCVYCLSLIFRQFCPISTIPHFVYA